MNFDQANRFRLTVIGAFGLSLAILASGCGAGDTATRPPVDTNAGRTAGGAKATGGGGGATTTGGVLGSGGTTPGGGATAGGNTSQAGSSATGGVTGNTGGSSGNTGGAKTGGGSAITGGSTGNTGGARTGGGAAVTGGSTGTTGGGSGTTGGNTGNTGGGSGTTGGNTGNTGGGTSTGGTSQGGSTATDLNCTDPAYGTVSIPAINVVSDFETDSLLQIVQDGRGVDADPWHAYAVDDVNDSYGEMQTPSVVNPKHANNNFKVDTTQHGPCSTKGALHVSSPGKAGDGSYAGFGIDFMARTAARKKQTYDASKYTGLGFWAKCSKDLQFAFFKAVDAAQDQDAGSTPACTYSANTCNQYGIKNAAITKDWSYYKLYFSELLQDPNGTTFSSGVDKSKLTAFQIHVNPFSPRSGSPGANDFDCYIDDVHFLTEATPATPAATVTWSTSGNVISRNGSPYKIRGLVRPSMEWDCAGFAITREDIQRMKTWKPNAIRLAVMDTLWSGASTGGATCNGPAYQRSVKRVVNWILQEGMDVILDLHYVGGSPTDAHRTFWTTVSNDAFFKDTRIIYELWNEPTAGQPALKDWMQATVTAIRANAPNNLILVSGIDYSYDISYYVNNKVTGGAIAYVTHPYHFKTTDRNTAYIGPAAQIPVVATEFGDANVVGYHETPATECTASIYSSYISEFEGAGMSWTSWAWIVDEWGCGFPQLIADYSGAPNAIGTPVRTQLQALNP